MVNEKWNNFKNCYINYDYSFPQNVLQSMYFVSSWRKKAFKYCMYLWLKCSWKWKSIQHLALPVHEGNKPFVIITFWFPQHMRVRTICVFICDYKCSKSNIWIKTLHWISSLWQKMILLSNLWLKIGQISTKDRID